MIYRFFSSKIPFFGLMTQRNLITTSYTFNIIPGDLPLITRNGIEYSCTEKFRSNFNANVADVWLIYQTPRKETWNVEIISRTFVSKIEPDLLERFASSDEDLVKYYAFNRDTIVKSGGKFSGDVPFTVEGPYFPGLLNSCNGDSALHLTSQYYIPNKTRKVLSSVLGVSGSQLRKISDSGILSLQNKSQLAKPFGKGCTVELDFPGLKQYLDLAPIIRPHS